MSATSALDAAMRQAGVLVGEVGKRQALVPLDSPSQAAHADGGSGVDCDMSSGWCPVCWPNVYAEGHAKHRGDLVVLPGPTLADGVAHLTAAGSECIATAPGYADMDPEWVHGSFWCALHDGADGRAS
ncbi:hypothetical protein [Nocardioides sp. BYT-33-1]|uniref:hypothetical protein n=1 Tax=Nocardioides sp. BYT-33-1 TaxID=3416952 RepID=UPI003F52EA23